MGADYFNDRRAYSKFTECMESAFWNSVETHLARHDQPLTWNSHWRMGINVTAGAHATKLGCGDGICGNIHNRIREAIPCDGQKSINRWFYLGDNRHNHIYRWATYGTRYATLSKP